LSEFVAVCSRRGSRIFTIVISLDFFVNSR
jgi:hypothetical protein